ncbi:interleukin-2 receptor subunit beta isoform X1 [Tachysurus fulvidraco]|uniref:interleukin-2 receptor subunit beta isoform X1 n=2 Tax=Tachysurus fulvidraco TaxID=1234273 RepID=UPI001FEDF2BC|nr:interleukin-2 receptor subunit beta isoform X1 [Tachysurus fulvidraco]
MTTEHRVPPSHLNPQEAGFPRCGLLTFIGTEKQVIYLQNTSRMKTKMLIGQILMLSTMSLIPSSKGSENLKCYTDGINVINCTWNTSLVEDRFHITPTTNCSLKSIFNDFSSVLQTPQSDLRPQQQPQLREGTLTFSKKSLIMGSPFVELYVWCENMLEPVEAIKLFHPPSNVKLYPPTSPLVEGANVTWQCGSPKSEFVRKVVYEVQWGLLENIWEKSQVASTEVEHCELPEDSLILGKKYVVRVRSVPANNAQIWSDWSPFTEWKSTVGLKPPHEKPTILGFFNILTSLGIIIAVAVILLAFFCLQRHKRIIKCHYVPTPAKYFGELFSDHGGEFKSWLGPTVNDLCIKTDSECISPVTIYKVCNTDMLYNKMEQDGKIKDSSSFSNSIYFLSQSSKSGIEDQLEPCSADCPYGPEGGGSVQENLPATHDNSNDTELNEITMSSPLETSSTYKQLQKLRLEIQSPDSGFAGSSSEQESQEESGSEGLPSPPVVDNNLPISCNLLCPVPQLIGVPHFGIPPGLTLNPWNNQTFPNLPPEISKNILLGNCGIMDCSGILEPSSDDYMPVKKVQG